MVSWIALGCIIGFVAGILFSKTALYFAEELLEEAGKLSAKAENHYRLAQAEYKETSSKLDATIEHNNKTIAAITAIKQLKEPLMEKPLMEKPKSVLVKGFECEDCGHCEAYDNRSVDTCPECNSPGLINVKILVVLKETLEH